MSEESFKRKLTAILSADVKGYSRLMGENEDETVKTITAYRKIIGELIHQHRGRVIDSPGDNILADFASVVDAVQCAVAVQNEFKARNAELDKNRRMEFRIGVNLGDVIEEENRIYGDGVNIAARLEALADAGGICISKTAFDQIETKLPLGYEYLGEQTVKNIKKPVGAYRVLMEPRITVIDAVEKDVPSRQRPLTLVIAGILILLVGALTLWQFVLRPSPPSAEKADPKKIESQLLAQLEAQKQATEQAQRATEDAKREALLQAQKQAAEETLRRAQEERNRLDQDRKQFETERRAADTAKKQAAEETLRRAQEERNRLDQDRKQLESEKRAAEAAKQQAAASQRVASHDGTYLGQLCNQVPNKAPFYWPVALVVRNGIAEGSWISSTKKTATARGTVAANGEFDLKLAAWTPTGTPTEATLLGRIVDGAITASGQWSNGPVVAGEWKRTQVAAAVPAAKAAPALSAKHDGSYSGQLCYPVPNKPPHCWPVALAVRNGIAEGTWIHPSKKTAKAHGTAADDGSVQLNLETWSSSGTPVEATLIGRIVDGAITASGQWSLGGEVAGEWKRTP